MIDTYETSPFLDGTLLVASPGMADPRFAGAVIFVCTHSDKGAMGLIINKPAVGVAFEDLAEQMEVEAMPTAASVPVMIGGPVERSRGFVLHSPDYVLDCGTLNVNDWCSMTGHFAVLRELMGGKGPEQAVLALGYSNWGPGQLEDELRDSSWLMVDASPELVFETDADHVWDRCLDVIGIDPAMLHSVAGSA